MKTVTIKETFEYFPDGSEATKRAFKSGAVEMLPDGEADSFVARGLADRVPDAVAPAPAPAPAPATQTRRQQPAPISISENGSNEQEH